jgi:hypothetical protein
MSPIEAIELQYAPFAYRLSIWDTGPNFDSGHLQKKQGEKNDRKKRH